MKFSVFKAALLYCIESYLSKRTVTIQLELTPNEVANVHDFCKFYKQFNENKTLTAVCNKYLKELERQNITIEN
jgi:hypothetical protein